MNDITAPPKSNASDPWPIDSVIYKDRHVIECFFQKITWFCRVFTRYDKLDISFFAFVYLEAIEVMLKYDKNALFFKQGLVY